MEQREIDREIVIACVIGDGCIVQHAKQGTYWLQLKHSPAQRDYLLWKVGLIESTRIVKGKTFTVRSRWQQHTNGRTYPTCTANIYGVKYFRVLRKWMYTAARRKTVRTILQYLTTPISVAILFMDDGSVNRRKRKHKDGTEYFLSPTMRLALCADLDECATLLGWLHDRFGIDGYPVRHSRKDSAETYYILNFNTANTRKLWDLIAPFAAGLGSMRRKFDLCFSAFPDALPLVARVPDDQAILGQADEMVRYPVETRGADLNGQQN